MRKVGRYVATLAVSMIVFSGCTSEDDARGANESTSETNQAGPELPELPAEATERTEAGAEAFARHYIELMNYAQASGEDAVLVDNSSIDCAVCSGYIVATREGYEDGGHIEGGTFTIAELATRPADYGADYGFDAVLNVAEQRQVRGDHVVVAQPFEYRIGLYPAWIDDEWTMLWIAVPRT